MGRNRPQAQAQEHAPSNVDEDLRRERERLAREYNAEFGTADVFTIEDYTAAIIVTVGKVDRQKPSGERKYLIQVAALALEAAEKSYGAAKPEPAPTTPEPEAA
jgi:hypothetical protein